jgi:hypothetical protein
VRRSGCGVTGGNRRAGDGAAAPPRGVPELAAVTGESPTDAVIVALRERLASEPHPFLIACARLVRLHVPVLASASRPPVRIPRQPELSSLTPIDPE